MRFPFLFKILIALLPLITALLIILYYVLKDVKGEVLLRKVIKNTSKTMIDVKVQGDAVEDEEKKGIISSYIKKQNAKLNVVGITYKFETVLAIASCIFIVSAIASKVTIPSFIFTVIWSTSFLLKYLIPLFHLEGTVLFITKFCILLKSKISPYSLLYIKYYSLKLTQ